MKRHVLISAAFLGLVATGCGAGSPPRELQDARTAYQRAARAPSASLAPVQMQEAQQALARAEKAYEDDGDDQSTRDLAYIAQRKVLSANAAAEAAGSLQQKQIALADLERAKQQQAQTAQQQLDQTKQRLSETDEMLQRERAARTAADQKAQEALSKIEGLESKMSEKGLVLTLSGSVLFATGKSQLLPNAKKRLSEVANAIKDDGRKILVVGHTDATGSEEKNLELSRRRADAVKGFLAQAGVPNDRISIEGMGEAEPIASNDTPEGRANNRRVEIILQNGQQGSGQQQQQQQQQQQPQPQQSP